jgi:hypothetical protein
LTPPATERLRDAIGSSDENEGKTLKKMMMKRSKRKLMMTARIQVDIQTQNENIGESTESKSVTVHFIFSLFFPCFIASPHLIT